VERVTIKYFDQNKQQHQSFCFRKDALSKVYLILITDFYPDHVLAGSAVVFERVADTENYVPML
jgi:L-ascorbate metabolism protein UlaG (beta-lactamase superfamily)